jgi:hypothetical protein
VGAKNFVFLQTYNLFLAERRSKYLACYRVVYGCLVGNYVPLVLVDSFGLSITFAFMLVYYRYTTNKKFVHRLWAIAGAGAVIVAVYVGIGLEGVTNQSQAQIAHVLGFLAAGLDILMSAAPMATIRHVIAIKDASSMPLTMSIAGLVNTVLWVTVSWDDWFLVVPNLIASCINVVAIVVYFIYRPGKYTTVTKLQDVAVRQSLASPGVAGKYAQMQSPTVELKKDEVLATP